MRKLILIALTAIVVIGCSKDEDDANNEMTSWTTWAYTDNFILENKTGKTIEVANNYPDDFVNLEDVTIVDAGENRKFIQYIVWLGACFFEDFLKDSYPDENHRFLMTNIDTHIFSILVDGKKVHDDVWLRKHWVYTPGYTEWTYTLTLTDELLKEIGWEEVEL